MTRDQALERMQTIFDEVFLDKVVVSPELSADNVEEWDSIVHVSLMVAVERAFQVRFRVGEVESLKNVGEFADLICKRANGAG
jgi:acyl carrier protein